MTSYWSCAQTHPNEEALAIRNLRRQHFNAFYPFFLQPNRWRKMAVKAVFPGYVFVELDDTRPNWSPINNTLGVKRLLTQSTTPGEYRQPARIKFVDELRRLHRHHQGALAEPDVLPPGTIVRIKRGPFAERVALVEMSSGDRVRLLLEAFNREIVVEFAVDDVVLIRRPTAALAVPLVVVPSPL